MFVRETVESVLRQNYSDVELIIVNDGSSAPSLEELLAGLPVQRVKIINHERNEGLAIARNTAFYASSGELILPLDADDLIEPDFISATVQVLKDNPDYSGVYTQVRIFGDMEMLWIPDVSLIKLMCGIPIQSTVLFKREVFEAVGGYSNEIIRSPDVDYWIRVLDKGYKLLRLDSPLYCYRKIRGSLSEVGRLTEVEDLARSNKELYLRNLQAVFSQEEQKFQELQRDFEELKDGYHKLFEGYTNLLVRISDVKVQLSRKNSKFLPERVQYLQEEELQKALEYRYDNSFRKPTDLEMASDSWIDLLVQGETKYFAAKENYAFIHNEFKKLEEIYLELHADFDQDVSRLQDLGVRNKILGFLRLPFFKSTGDFKNGSIK